MRTASRTDVTVSATLPGPPVALAGAGTTVAHILAPVEAILPAVEAILAPVDTVLDPVSHAAVMTAVVDILGAVSDILTPVTDVLAAVIPILEAVWADAPIRTDARASARAGGVFPVGPLAADRAWGIVVEVQTVVAVFVFALKALMRPVMELFSQAGMIVEKPLVGLWVSLLEMPKALPHVGLLLLHQLAELLGVFLFESLQHVLPVMLELVHCPRIGLGVGFLQMRQPLPYFGLLLLNQLFELLGVLFLKLMKPAPFFLELFAATLVFHGLRRQRARQGHHRHHHHPDC